LCRILLRPLLDKRGHEPAVEIQGLDGGCTG
jgi:hypothetical protein